jgi:hypothetical protein
MYPGKSNTGENPAGRWGLCFALISLIIERKWKEKGTHYGVSFGIVS